MSIICPICRSRRTWPVYIPKDMLANWFEAYVDALELNFWTGTELVGGSYDDEAPAMVRSRCARSDGSEARHAPAPSHLRNRREQHSLYAGAARARRVSPAPSCIPAISRTPRSGRAARPWCWAPAPAAMTSRRNCTRTAPTSPSSSAAETYVVSLKEAQSVYAIYSEGIPFEDCDLLATSFPYPVLQRSYQLSTAHAAARSTRRCWTRSKSAASGCTSAKTTPASR